MKKVLLLMLAASLTFGCKKKEEDKGPTGPDPNNPELTQRMPGTWQLIEISYDGTVPNPLDPLNPIELKGDGKNVEGEYTFKRNPDEVDFFISFDAEIDFMGSPQTVPFDSEGEGEWSTTSDNKRIIIKDKSTQEEIIFQVRVNEHNRQEWDGKLTTTIQGFSLTIDISVVLTR